VSRSALLWAALNMHFAASPGRRRQIFAETGDLGAGGPSSLEPLTSELHPGWEQAAQAELSRARSRGVSILTLEDARYPDLLRASSDPPWLMYARGDLRPEDVLSIAVVGSRRATPHGLAAARAIGRGLAEAGYTVVSGMARGIDAAAHAGALEAGGRTIAVLGSGLDRIYPVEHRRLFDAIAASGAVLTEFPFGAAPLKRHFPERNRVIAALSWATVVVEAARGSGSLITAELAADEGRAVYAVPGTVDEPNAAGTNGLLRAGALVCRSAADVVEDLAAQVADAARAVAAARRVRSAAADRPEDRSAVMARRRTLTDDQRRVLEHLPRTRGIGVEALAGACGLAPGTLLAALLELELLGLVRRFPGPRFTSAACKI